MLEKNIQTKIKKKLELEGWFVIKLITTSCNGIPDLLCLKNGETMFIEVKRPNGVLSELQKFRINELRSRNITVKIWQDYDQEFQESKTDLKSQQEHLNF